MTKSKDKPAAIESGQPSQLKQAPIPAPAKDEPKRSSPSKPKPASTGMPTPKATSKAKAGASAPSKQDRVVAMLRKPEGTTVAAIMKATGWQKHSVHGFLAGVVRKKLGLNLISEKKDDVRIYRIVAAKPGKAGSSSRKRAA